MITALVGIKRVALDTRGVGQQFGTNPFDEVAMEAALRLRESSLLKRVIAVTVGPGASHSDEALRSALAMGADHALHVQTSAETPLHVAGAISLAVRRDPSISLVVLGQQSSDTGDCQVPQALAGILGWPQVTFATSVSKVDARSLRVTRETESGSESLVVSLPAVVSCSMRLGAPRIAGLQGVIRARKAPIERFIIPAAADGAGLPAGTVDISVVPARSRPRKKAIFSTAKELVDALKADGIF